MAMSFALSTSVSFAAEVFAVSTFVLFCGMLGLVWRDVVNVSFLSNLPLNTIEKQHPHIPSLKIVAGIVMCVAGLMGGSLSSGLNAAPFREPGGWIYLSVFFVILGAFGILAEIRWNAGDYAFAFTIATAISFVSLVLRHTDLKASPERGFALLVILFVSAVLAWMLFFQSFSNRVKIVGFATFLLWLGVFG